MGEQDYFVSKPFDRMKSNKCDRNKAASLGRGSPVKAVANADHFSRVDGRLQGRTEVGRY